MVCEPALWDHHQGRNRFDGIVLQEYDHQQQRLIGPITNIWAGELGCTEGPHILQKDGWYYLICAEGLPAMAISVARSKSIAGPYENHPKIPYSRPLMILPSHSKNHGDLSTVQMVWYTTIRAPLNRTGSLYPWP